MERLRDRLGSEGVVSLDPLTSTPRVVGRTDAFLTGPSSRPAEAIALDYVRGNLAGLGLTAASLESLKLVRDYVSAAGTHHLYWIQLFDGVPVFGNGLRANVTKDGELVNVLGSPVRASSGGGVSRGIGAAAAVAAARANAEKGILPVPTIKVTGKPPAGFVTEPTQFANGDSARQVWFQGVRGLRLAWRRRSSAATTATCRWSTPRRAPCSTAGRSSIALPASSSTTTLAQLPAASSVSRASTSKAG